MKKSIWDFESKIGWDYTLVGTNNLGEKIKFYEWITADAPELPLRCWLRDVDEGYYYPSSEGVTSYELQWYNDETKEYIGEKFVIEIDE